MRQCFLHIGTHKTGTKSLQHFLADNEGRLREAGIYYPVTGRNQGLAEDDDCAHHFVAFHMIHFGESSFAEGGTVAKLIAELRDVLEPVVCLSSESFANLYREPALLKRLATELEAIGFETSVIVYLRPQVDLITALLAQLVQAGLKMAVHEFVDTVVRDGMFTMDDTFFFEFEYSRLLQPFSDAFGSDRCYVRRYESGGDSEDLLRGFLAIVAAGTDLDFASLTPVGALNSSKSFGDVLDRLISNYAESAGVSSPIAADGILLEGAVPNLDCAFDPIGPEDCLRIVERFSPDNALVGGRYGIHLSALGIDRLPFDPASALAAAAAARHRRDYIGMVSDYLTNVAQAGERS